MSAREIANLIRAKKLSAREVLTAHLKQIERVDPTVNAIVTLVADQAMETARRADEAQAQGKPLGALHGLPVAHKDFFDTAGIRTMYGSLIFKDNVPKQDAIIVERINKAGAVTIGKTNTPEFGTGSQTFNAVFGSTKNPYDLSKTCGGSSGGAAVSLACGMISHCGWQRFRWLPAQPRFILQCGGHSTLTGPRPEFRSRQRLADDLGAGSHGAKCFRSRITTERDCRAGPA